MPRRTLRLTLEALEVARGHDGFLRGKPEPALLVALYRTNGVAAASLVGRLLVRAQLTSPIPCSVELAPRELHYDARFAASERIVLLAFAVEEDSGRGVEALYRALETPEQLFLYRARDVVPTPRSLDEWARDECTVPAAEVVEILCGTSSVPTITWPLARSA